MSKIIIAKAKRNGKSMLISARIDYKNPDRINVFSYALGNVFHYFETDMDYVYVQNRKVALYLKTDEVDIIQLLKMVLKPQGVELEFVYNKSREEITQKLIKNKVVERIEGE